MPTRKLNMKLRYEGAEVHGGAMPLDEVVTALQGFAGAYGKVANSLIPSSTHQLRVAAVDKGSFVLDIVAWASENQDTLKAIGVASTAARYVFGVVKDVIEAKKHTKGKTYEVSIQGSNNVVLVVNDNGDSRPIQREAYEILKSRLIDRDLPKIACPLSEGSIDSSSITSSGDDEPME